ncbi:polysaccharide biosynthesis/export family protein [Mucilaginibacter gynuensis]|uniref:Polysaccharide biosynthesis/export family protein n=2 Tax=Mucilaginibacter gynuensis TaxID=1302236 RepID=A0ABP8G492_9SPHI
MKNHLYKGLLFVIIAVLSACTAQKDTSYFQGLKRNSELSYKINNYSPLTIQSGDILALNIKSLNSEGSAVFNTAAAAGAGDAKGAAGAAGGYLVSEKGEIELPLVHSLKVSGLTLVQAQATIQKAITPYLKEPLVTVSLVNFKISVMGDVSHPDVFSVSSDRITIPQAITLAGDLTSTAKRNNVLLIREIEGERKFVNIDLTSAQLFDSPYYYLKNNDVLYVEAGKSKFKTDSPILKIIPIILSVASLVLVSIQLGR